MNPEQILDAITDAVTTDDGDTDATVTLIVALIALRLPTTLTV